MAAAWLPKEKEKSKGVSFIKNILRSKKDTQKRRWIFLCGKVFKFY